MLEYIGYQLRYGLRLRVARTGGKAVPQRVRWAYWAWVVETYERHPQRALRLFRARLMPCCPGCSRCRDW